MAKAIYTPLGVIFGVLGGLLGGVVFKHVWKLIAKEEDARRPSRRSTAGARCFRPPHSRAPSRARQGPDPSQRGARIPEAHRHLAGRLTS